MSNRPRVLVADDEVRFAEALRQGLSRTDFDVTVVNDGDSALTKALGGGFDLILLDLMLPGLSGYRVVERLRAAGNQTPIMMLTAKDGEYDEADAFDLGVDDYLIKPFSTVVLLARMRSLLRRSPDAAAPEVIVGDLRLDARKHRCTIGDSSVTLTPREFDVTLYLAQRAGSVVSKRELLDQVWDEPELDPNVVEVCILQVRKKLGNSLINTVRGVGYRLGE
jgi:DNA-binding response OmpR family regulator